MNYLRVDSLIDSPVTHLPYLKIDILHLKHLLQFKLSNKSITPALDMFNRTQS
jgi:hypothetical protein